MVGGCEEKKEEEEEKTWLDLYVYYTTQYRKDNLLLFISVTRDVSHSDILPYVAITSADGLFEYHFLATLLIFPLLISSSATTLVVPHSERSSRKSTAV